MSRKVNNIEFRGNDHFFGTGILNNKSLRDFIPEGKQKELVELGNGILRPSKRPSSSSLQKPYKPTQKFTPDGHLTDDEKMKRLSDQVAEQVAETIQQRIDEGAIKYKAKVDQQAPVETQQKETKASASKWTPVFWIIGIGGVLGIAYGLYTQLDFSNPKKA